MYYTNLTVRPYDTIIASGTCAYGCGRTVWKDDVLFISDKLCYLCGMMRLNTNDHKHYITVVSTSSYPEPAGMRPIWWDGTHIGWKCTGSEHSAPCTLIRTDSLIPISRARAYNRIF